MIRAYTMSFTDMLIMVVVILLISLVLLLIIHSSVTAADSADAQTAAVQILLPAGRQPNEGLHFNNDRQDHRIALHTFPQKVT